MRLSSARTRATLLTLVLLVLVGAALLGSRRDSSQYLTPAELTGARAPVGETVRLMGSVIATEPGVVVLAAEDATAPVVRVVLSGSSRATFGLGVVVGVQGTLTAPGHLEDGRVLVPTGPSRHTRDPDG